MSGLPTVSDADRCFSYEPTTGLLIWKETAPQRWRVGTVAGSANAAGYICVCLNGKHYLAHRVAWLLSHGDWPVEEIDHINGVHGDNRLCNLRQASRGQNKMNRGRHSRNASGIKGVSWSKSVKKWRAQIMADGRYRCLGYYSSATEAGAAYAAAATVLHGVFARTDSAPLDVRGQISA